MDPATRFTWRELKVYVGIMFILDLLHHVMGLVENFCSLCNYNFLCSYKIKLVCTVYTWILTNKLYVHKSRRIFVLKLVLLHLSSDVILFKGCDLYGPICMSSLMVKVVVLKDEPESIRVPMEYVLNSVYNWNWSVKHWTVILLI